MKKLFALLAFIPGLAQAQDFGAMPYNFVAGTPADASQAMANFQALVNGGNAAGAAIATALAAKQLVPSGAYLYFFLASCPAGWTRPTAYDLKFVRGLDNGAGRDTTGTSLGGFEANADQDHSHSATINYVSTLNMVNYQDNTASAFPRPLSSLNLSPPNPLTGTAASGNAGTETRPMDMPLLLCQKD